MLARPERVRQPRAWRPSHNRPRWRAESPTKQGRTLQPAGVLRLAVAGEVDDVRRRVDRGEELRDPHAQVAVHPVGDHLCLCA